jgi:GNAT superfamily N-acetyltransferase
MGAERAAGVAIRAFDERDFDELVARWHATNLVSYRYNEVQQQHTLAGAREFFRNRLLQACTVLVATGANELAGVLALQAPWVRTIAVFPEHQRKGIGSALLQEARALPPRVASVHVPAQRGRPRLLRQARVRGGRPWGESGTGAGARRRIPLGCRNAGTAPSMHPVEWARPAAGIGGQGTGR